MGRDGTRGRFWRGTKASSRIRGPSVVYVNEGRFFSFNVFGDMALGCGKMGKWENGWRLGFCERKKKIRRIYVGVVLLSHHWHVKREH